jgi:hypothetical protein
MVKLPKEYSQLKDSDFPAIIGGISYESKQELAERYEADLMALAQLLYDIWQDSKISSLNDGT